MDRGIVCPVWVVVGFASRDRRESATGGAPGARRLHCHAGEREGCYRGERGVAGDARHPSGTTTRRFPTMSALTAVPARARRILTAFTVLLTLGLGLTATASP